MEKPLTMKKELSSTISLVQLGCPKNLVDGEIMLGTLRKAGYTVVKEGEPAEVIIVNTCGFVEDAKRESIEAIFQAIAAKKNAGACKIVVSGCLSQRYRDVLIREFPEVDVFVGLNDVENLPHVLSGETKAPIRTGKKLLPEGFDTARYVPDAAAPRFPLTPSFYAYLKISEGCDLPCTFCVIPKIRGPHRSRPLDDIVAEAQRLARQGVREVCLVAQDSTWYGTDLYGKSKITELLRALSKVNELDWIRLHYLYPTRVTEEFLDVMAQEPKLCPYFDVPLQHAGDRILEKMRRLGRRKDYEKLLDRIRRKIPHAAIRSTFIVGFPGETDDDFEELLDFLKYARLDFAGFFAFSKEENTSAADLDGTVPKKVIRERLRRAEQCQEEIARNVHEKRVGRVLDVQVEGQHGGEWFGRTVYQAPDVDGVTWLENVSKTSPGEKIRVEVSGVVGQDWTAKPLPAAV